MTRRSQGTSTFLFRRARLDLRAKLFKYYEIKFLPDFAGGQVVIQDAYLNINYVPWARFKDIGDVDALERHCPRWIGQRQQQPGRDKNTEHDTHEQHRRYRARHHVESTNAASDIRSPCAILPTLGHFAHDLQRPSTSSGRAKRARAPSPQPVPPIDERRATIP